MNLRFFLLCFIVFCIQCKSLNIDQLTLDQKIGQLFMVAAVADEEVAKDFLHKKTYRLDKEYIEQLIAQYHIGGIIYLGKSDLNKQIERTQHFQNISVIPLLIGQDLEPGRVGISRLEQMRSFGNNKSLGENNSIGNTYDTAFAIGQLCKKLGVHINFAPVADVNNNPNNPVINDRSFGDNPELVTQHAIAFSRGLRDTGILACAKHFPGHGDTDVDSHLNLPLIPHDRNRLHAIELYPFKRLIATGIPAIMIAHLEVPAFEEQKKLPSSFSKKIVTGLLRKELGFEGLIITDGLDMQGVTNYFADEQTELHALLADSEGLNMQGVTQSCANGQAELHALLAGNDILLGPIDVPAAVAAIKQAIKDELITEQEIDTHVERILETKNLICHTTLYPNSPL